MTYISLCRLWRKSGKKVCVERLKSETDECLDKLLRQVTKRITSVFSRYYDVPKLKEIRIAIMAEINVRDLGRLSNIKKHLQEALAIAEDASKKGSFSTRERLNLCIAFLSARRDFEEFRDLLW